MLVKLYLYLLSIGFLFIKKIHYGIPAWKKFFGKWLTYRYRDEMSEWRAREYEKYLHDPKHERDLFTHIDQEWSAILKKSLANINLIARNNYIRYSDLFDQRLINDQREFSKYVLSHRDKYNFSPYFDYLFLTNDYYLTSLDGIVDSLSWNTILDCGAFLGDTAMPLALRFPTSKIIAFEPEESNYKYLVKNIANNTFTDQIIPVKMGVGNIQTTTTISNSWAWAKIGEPWWKAVITTIDTYVMENNLNTWLIKWDIEWFEYESIIGAEQTIKTQKPILIISLYHRGKDFFEIKPLLDSRNLNYKYTVRKRNCFHPFADTVLICY